MTVARYRLVLVLLGWTALGSAMAADQSPPPQTAPPPDAAADHSGASTPDDDLIEFLGADDVGDAAWWEFLKKSGPPQEDPGAPPDAKP